MRGWVIVASCLVGGCADKESSSTKGAPARSPTHESTPGSAREASGSEAGDASASGSSPGSATGARGSIAGDSLTPQPFHEQAESGTKGAEAMVRTYRVTWTNVKSTPPCWYFSGPAGRDTPLGDRIEVRLDGGHASATWSKATFEGTWGETAIDVLRLATHRYQGTWVISERLSGRVKEKGIHAKYTYSECQQGTHCPGDCKITADVLLVPD